VRRGLSERGPPSSVRWSHGSSAFDLWSPEPEVLERATTIFSPWSAMPGAIPLLRWEIARARSAPSPEDAWEVQSRTEDLRSLQGSLSAALMTVEFLSVRALLDQPAAPLGFHGALVGRDGRGVLVLGPGESGKSTLACALWQRGYVLLCDDVTLVDADTLAASPTPRRVSLRSGSRALLGEETIDKIKATASCDEMAEGWLFHPQEVDRVRPPSSVQLVAAVFLARRGSDCAPGALARIEPAAGLLDLLPYSNAATRLDLGAAIRGVQPLASTIPLFDLGRGPLEDMAARVDEIVSAAA
jgi:hypothetical protein